MNSVFFPSLLIRKRAFPLMTVVVGAVSVFVYVANAIIKIGKCAPYGLILGIVLCIFGFVDLLYEMQESVEE